MSGLIEARGSVTTLVTTTFVRAMLDKIWLGNRWLTTTALCLCMSLFLISTVSASAQLIMVEETGCPYCERFNAEIAPVYPNTDEGSIAPLHRVNIDDGWPAELSHIKTESLTPTFILIQDNRELGRLHGYQGDEFFWFLLGELFEKLTPDTGEAKK